MRIVKAAICALAMASTAVMASGQAPTGPIKVLSGFPAGGPPDLVLRKIADKLSEQMATPVVVENRPGASGTLAAAAVARAEPDGRTLLFGVAATLALAPATMPSPPYDPVTAFTPIVEVARGSYVLLVRSDSPARSFGEFVQWAKDHPGKLNYASVGRGSAHHIGMEMLRRAGGGLDVVHVPYRSSLYGPLLAGDVQVMFESMPGPLPHLESGKLRALAVTGQRRLARLPEVPTLVELGVKDVELNSWWGFVGPAGMPKALVESLNQEIRKAMADPSLLSQMATWSIELTPGSPEAFGRYIADENQRWRTQVRQLGLAPE